MSTRVSPYLYKPGVIIESASGTYSTSDQLNACTTTNLLEASSGSFTGSTTKVISSAYSKVEDTLVTSTRPIDVLDNEIITVNGQTGIWANKTEVLSWRGDLPISEYKINDDHNADVIRKRTDQVVQYEHEIAVRYLRPPTPTPPGEIIVNVEPNIPTAAAPPLVIRQQPPRPETPPPLVLREAPPKLPMQIARKVINIPGKRIPPPPRKVIIERLPPLPAKPQPIIIERWLPYKEQERRVIFQKSNEPDPIVVKPKNVIIQWEQPEVRIRKEIRDLGVIRANPAEYVERYRHELKDSHDLPEFVSEIRPPSGVKLAAELHSSTTSINLYGDLEALKLIDLDREGLSQYKHLVYGGSTSSSTKNYSTTSTTVTSKYNKDTLISDMFARVHINSIEKVTRSEAERILFILNSELGRRYNEDEERRFLDGLRSDAEGLFDLEEFKSALFKLSYI